ncbi:MAG: 4-hydroxybenzoate 3-monooxygenase [Pseudomonadales bacterium]|nr:4-hydroxybenzoate 3-monooxygenase [Pseudomonadales bacterium]
MQTQIEIIGAGPAGLLLSHLLARKGIESIVLESKSREYVENRVRAGVLEQGTVNLLAEAGLGERLLKEGMPHHGIEIRFGANSHRIDFDELTDGKGITIYGQQEVVKDLISTRLKENGKLLFETSDVEILNPLDDKPAISFKVDGTEQQIQCDLIAGCDGFHGVSRNSIPEEKRKNFSRDYPFAWLGILVDAPPSSAELVYANSTSGFALHSMRSPSITRNYIQCDPEDSIENWSNDRIWQALHDRLETVADWKLVEGEIIEKAITPMRSFVCETMRYGRLLLAGDAAHIVPPTGAKGMNLAISDVNYLSDAIVKRYQTGSEELLDSYTEKCLRRIWRGEHFSWYMTSLLHKFPESSPFQERLQSAELEYVCQSQAASRSLAENYVGFKFK